MVCLATFQNYHMEWLQYCGYRTASHKELGCNKTKLRLQLGCGRAAVFCVLSFYVSELHVIIGGIKVYKVVWLSDASP